MKECGGGDDWQLCRSEYLIRVPDPDTAASCLAAASGRLNYVKNTPFCSRPRTERRFRVGLGGSDSNENPSCSDDHLIVVCVEKNVPLKCSEVLVICAVSIAPFHSMSNETLARTGKIGGIPFGGTTVAGSPRPCVSELARSWSSKTSMSRTCNRACA